MKNLLFLLVLFISSSLKAIPLTETKTEPNIAIFRGYHSFNMNKIIWITSYEKIENSYFILEHSPNNKDFYPIREVIGSGNFAPLSKYSHMTVNYFPITYYRIKQVHYNGKIAISKTIIIKSSKKKL